MADNYIYVLNLVFLVFSATLISQALAFTEPLEVSALQDLYRKLNFPSVLKGWNGSDPCGESWTGVTCSGSSVIHLKIQGLHLTGYFGSFLHNLQNLKQLEVSVNDIMGEIPYRLPPNATHINMACNSLIHNIPHSLPTMKKLIHLNLSYNFLYGPIANVFTDLDNLKEMDLSNNYFTGDLPSSFGSLTNIERLFLQHNKFTGSVTYLADLPLIDLNIQENMFNGILPQHFQSIPNLWINGNKFQAVDNSPPWTSPLDSLQNEDDGRYYAPLKHTSHRILKKRMGHGGIAFMVGAGTLLATGFALLIAIRLKKFHSQKMKTFESHHSSSFPYDTIIQPLQPK